jgi:seryl-tRNA synthetase
MFNIIFSYSNKFSQTQVKFFKERISYLSPKIIFCSLKKNKIKIHFNEKINKNEKFLFLSSIKKLIKRTILIKKISDEEIIFENDVKCSNKKKIFQHLKNIQSIKKIAPGIFSLRGKFLNYFNKLDEFLQKRSIQQKYENIHVHSMLPLDSFINNGYIMNFPQHVMFASNIKRNLKYIDKASSLNDLKKFKKVTDDPELVISPTVCYHIFETFKNVDLPRNKVFNSISSCNRFESINYCTFERLQSFTMREYVAFGSKKFIKSFLQNNIKYFQDIFVKSKIKFKIVTANDAFFSQTGIKKMAYQSLNNLKFEFQFWLPNEKKWLAVGSFNNHMDTLVKKYKISLKKNKNNFYSGCIGWGYERLVYSILSQEKKLVI